MIKTKINCKTDKFIINDFSSIKLQDEKIYSQADCGRIYNLNNSSGVLKRGMGIRALMVYDANDLTSLQYPLAYDSLGLDYFNKVMYFKQYFASSGDTTHRLLIHGSDNKLYLYQMFSNLVSPNWVYGLEFDSIPIVLEYKKDGLDSILISANDKLVVWSTGRTPYELSNVPTITSMCVHNDVLYCTIAGETDKIWYTENLNPESVGVESEETKYLIMEGSAGGGQKIVKLKENMYVFCDYGIGRINTYAKSEPTYNQIYLTNGQICPNTVVVCGDFVIFLTREGLYKFNGTSVTKIDALHNQLKGCFTDYAVATILNDNYYLALSLDFNDNTLVGCEFYTKYKNNALIKMDINDYSFEIMRGVDVKDMLALKAGIEEKVVLTFNTYYQDFIGEITEEGGTFQDVWSAGYCTNYISTSNMEPITIRQIKVDALKHIQIKIITEERTVSVETYCDGINEFQVIVPCSKFKVEICSKEEKINVRSIEIEYVKQC